MDTLYSKSLKQAGMGWGQLRLRHRAEMPLQQIAIPCIIVNTINNYLPDAPYLHIHMLVD
jgi:hypothetical protein